MHQLLIKIPSWCWQHTKLVAFLGLISSLTCGWYGVNNLVLDADQSHMISANLPFRLAEQEIDKAFPRDTDLLVAVIDAPTSDQAESAINALQNSLQKQTDLFIDVFRPAEEVFFRRHGLIFLTTNELTELTDQLAAAQPMIGELARDPSLRGLLSTTAMAIKATDSGALDQQGLGTLLDQLNEPARAIIENRPPPPTNWQKMLGPFGDRDSSRRILLTRPRLHYDRLTAGDEAAAAIREAAKNLNGITLRLTGPVALSDANFTTVTDGARISVPLILITICGLLAWAVRSLRAMLAVLLSMIAGLLATLAFAAFSVGVLNPISVAFAVMFVGIAVDFGIQFVIRFQELNDGRIILEEAARETALSMAVPLSIAALATSVGFLSFLPTDYTGVSQLGLIAGGGMIIALIIDFSLLPALLALFPPKARVEPLGLPWQKLDHWLTSHCRTVVIFAMVLALIGICLIPRLPVDFDPIHLQNPKDEAVTSFLELGRNPDNGVYALDLLAKNRQEAENIVKLSEKIPEILRAESLLTFVPDDQNEKLLLLKDISSLLGPSLSPLERLSPPDFERLAEKLRQTASLIASHHDATGLSMTLQTIADSGEKSIMAFQDAELSGLSSLLTQLRILLAPEPVSLEGLPDDIKQNWITPDNRWRVKLLPRDDMENLAKRKNFLEATKDLPVKMSGLPISIEQSGRVVSKAFIRAGLTAIMSIGILLWLLLRRVKDALLVLVPLILAGLYTIIGCVLTGISINFANIIALPLLLGIGVAFNIYFVINWRRGLRQFFSTATARAILFSALTTGSAFGSLAVSPHPGTASMGLLLFLSLGLSVLTTFTVLPAILAWLNIMASISGTRSPPCPPFPKGGDSATGKISPFEKGTISSPPTLKKGDREDFIGADKFLIVTADDFGRCLPINEAVEEAHRNGILTAASLMVTGNALDDAVLRARKMPDLAVGLHITLVDGLPAMPEELIPDLLGPDSRFSNDLTWLGVKIGFLPRVRRQIEKEMRRQFDLYASLGLPLDHVDSHHHYHLHPVVSSIMFRLACEYGAKAVRIPKEPPFISWQAQRQGGGKRFLTAIGHWPLTSIMRSQAKKLGLSCNDRVLGLYDSGNMDAKRVARFITLLPDGLSEIYCHPANAGWNDHPMPDDYHCIEEYKALINPNVVGLIKEKGIKLTNFSKRYHP